MVIVYGLTDHIPQLAGLTPAQIAAHLREIGCDAVFLKHLHLDWIEALHATGLQVYASHGVFVDNADLWQQFPDSRPITAHGEPAPEEEWYRPLRPTHREIWALRLDQLAQLAADLPLDGVWLDFIRWPARWEKPSPRLYDSSFDEETLAQFQEEVNLELPATEPAKAAAWIRQHAHDAWIDWRCALIVRFVSEAAARMRSHRPQAKLGVFTIPWIGDAATDGTGIDQAGRRIVGQDLRQLGQHVDVISPMVYHRLCGRGPDWVGRVASWAAQQTAAAIWPVIEAIEPAPAYPAVEFAAVVRQAYHSDSNLIIFKLEGLLADPAKQASLRTDRKG